MFRVTRPLRFSDCDPSGIAYFPSYLDMMVGVSEEFFAQVGAPWHELLSRHRIGVPTVTLNVTFSRPGFHGDMLEFTVRLRRMGNSSADFVYEVRSHGELLWSAEQRLVATSLETRRAVPWPADIRAAFSSHLEE